MQPVDILITHGYIVTLNKKMEILEDAALAISEGDIVEIGKTTALEKKYTAEKIMDATSKIVMPGLINGHTHIPMTYFRGYADDLVLQDWLQKYIWPAEEKFVKADFVYDAALHGCAELIKNGVTMFNDMYFYSQETARAVEKAGLRAILGEGILDFPMAFHKNADSMITYALEGHEKYKNNELIDFAIMPHAIYTCSKENLIHAAKVAREHGMLIHTHVSETKKEVDDCVREHDMRPIQYLESIGFLGEDVSIAHGVWIDDQEQKILAENGTSVNICTECNLKLSSGFAPINGYRKNGVIVNFGTDGVASNNNLSIFDEMDITSKVHKAINNDPTFLPADDVVKMATIDAAEGFHKVDTIGSLEKGKKADLITIDMNRLENLPMYNVYSHLVYTMHSDAVKDVVVDGKLLMEDRKLFTIDEEALRNKSDHYSKELKKNIS